jgi:hypothetical protein
MKTTKTYTVDDLTRDLKELKESGTCPVQDPKFYEVWDWVDHNKTEKN